MKLGRKMYLWLGLLAGPAALIGLKVYTKITKTPRVRVVVMNESGKILLLKNVLSLKDQWTLPGGGVEKGESHEQAAQRELREETGIVLPLESFRFVTTLNRSESGLRYTAPIVSVECASLNLPSVPFNPREIAATGWFDPENLPTGSAELVGAALLVVGRK